SPGNQDPVHVRLHGKCHWTQWCAGCGNHPAPEAIYPSRAESESAGSSRYSAPPGGHYADPLCNSNRSKTLARKAHLAFPGAALQSAPATQVSDARRRWLAQRDDGKHQPLRLVIPGGRPNSRHRATGNQSGAASGNRRTGRSGSGVPGRDRAHRGRRIFNAASVNGGEDFAILLPARIAVGGSVGNADSRVMNAEMKIGFCKRYPTPKNVIPTLSVAKTEGPYAGQHRYATNGEWHSCEQS